MNNFKEIEFGGFKKINKNSVFPTRIFIQLFILLSSIIITSLVVATKKNSHKDVINKNITAIDINEIGKDNEIDALNVTEYENCELDNSFKSSKFEKTKLKDGKKTYNKEKENVNLKDLNIIGKYKTRMKTEREKEKNRVFNIKKAASFIDGVIIKPGEVFSFHKNVWGKNKTKQYKEADNFTINGMDKGLAGGVCQLSSTLYIAAIYANMQIIERHPHSREVEYVPRGLDAAYCTNSDREDAVSGKDLKIKNLYKYPVIIKATATNSSVKVCLYSKQDNDFEVSIYPAEVKETINSVSTSVLVQVKIKGEELKEFTIRSSYKKDKQIL